ncbi:MULTISPECIES: helix-turn-helix domain-containing protein [Streptomyces]|uniref:helix-turn-helix domain-containing protein n=1 Tax=Streptomyces TaxID=1883 RepID=UPI001786042B|nr:helix-turn-helix transcriptional regulator [Streptomyces filipinensis]
MDYTVREVGEHAQFLRDARTRAGITYAEMAKTSQWSAASFKRAASGKTLPAQTLALGYLRACGVGAGSGLLLRWTSLHARAAVSLAVRARQAATGVRPHPQFVRDRADLSGALRDAYAAAGRPSFRAMALMAGGWRLPRSTAHSIVSARSLPGCLDQYIAFLTSCGVGVEQLPPWFAAWHKVMGEPGPGEVRAYGSSHWKLRTQANLAYCVWLAGRSGEAPAPLIAV